MNLVERVKKILLTPRQEWAVINGETHTVAGLYTQYVMILAAIPAVCASPLITAHSCLGVRRIFFTRSTRFIRSFPGWKFAEV